MKQLMIMMMLFATLSIAQQDRMDDDDAPPMHGRDMKQGVMKMLDLTDDQAVQFKKLHSDFQKKQIELRAKVQSMRVSLRDLFDDDKTTQDQIESQIGDISKAQNEMKLNAVGLWFKVNKILTPEQQKKWKQHRMMMGGEEGFQHGMMNKSPMRHGPGMKGKGMMRMHRMN